MKLLNDRLDHVSGGTASACGTAINNAVNATFAAGVACVTASESLVGIIGCGIAVSTAETAIESALGACTGGSGAGTGIGTGIGIGIGSFGAASGSSGASGFAFTIGGDAKKNEN